METKTYKIPEAKIEELRKLMTRIQKKCTRYGQEFHFAEVGETFEEVTVDGRTHNIKFITVEACGTAIINNWEFVASIEHLPAGNIISIGYTGAEVPQRYRTSDGYCEHCGSKRFRKETYIVRNTETGEFKQVGKSCLKDYTNGMDAAHIAALNESLAYLEDCSTTDFGGFSVVSYYEPKKFLQYVIETVKHFGYVPSSEYSSTRSRTSDFFYLLEENWAFSPSYREVLTDEIKRVGYNPLSEENAAEADAMINWLFNEADDSSDFIHNLKVIFSEEYTRAKFFGYIAGLVPAYNKTVKRVDTAEKAKELYKSTYQGAIGDKLIVDVASAELITYWSTQWGMTYVYKFTNIAGDVFTWKTSNWLNLDKITVKTVTGTVKAHNEYRNEQQTELTRCKVA
jgi:hypothetical protein